MPVRVEETRERGIIVVSRSEIVYEVLEALIAHLDRNTPPFLNDPDGYYELAIMDVISFRNKLFDPDR